MRVSSHQITHIDTLYKTTTAAYRQPLNIYAHKHTPNHRVITMAKSIHNRLTEGTFIKSGYYT